MAIPASNTLTKIYDDTEGDINIQVVGYQWKWQYKYLEDDIDFFQNLTTRPNYKVIVNFTASWFV